MVTSNPIFKDKEDGKWYFWNETWSDQIGPYDTEEIAQQELTIYATNL